jgi:hypothetical protein
MVRRVGDTAGGKRAAKILVRKKKEVVRERGKAQVEGQWEAG